MKNQNFILVMENAINSYGEFFSVNEIVGHEGASKDIGIIKSFEIDTTSNEVVKLS